LRSKDRDDSTDLSDLTLPEPGQPNSLSHNKNIRLGTTTPFVTTWKTNFAGVSIMIPVAGVSGAYAIDWGDGTSTSSQAIRDHTHTYGDVGTYTVTISGGLTWLDLGSAGQTNAKKLALIEQLGSTEWESMDSALQCAGNMVYNAVDSPNLLRVETMRRCFMMPLSSTATSPDGRSLG